MITFKNNHTNTESVFLKIESGKPVEGYFVGEPYELYIHWNDLTKRSLPCTAHEGACEGCNGGLKKSWKVRFNFLVEENGNLVSKILEQGSEFSYVMEDVQTSFDLHLVKCKISRKVNGKKSVWTVMPLPQFPTKAVEGKIAQVKLHDLAPKKTVGQTNEDIPF